MKQFKITQKIFLVWFVATGFISFSAFSHTMDAEAKAGKKMFEGSTSFQNGGPACISCHNVSRSDLIPGGLLAKDLTKVYERMGDGITGWLENPPFPAMIKSYEKHPLTDNERGKLTAFFKHTNEVVQEEPLEQHYNFMLLSGIGEAIVILICIVVLWRRRKKETVKKEIFDRQSKAYDAKF